MRDEAILSQRMTAALARECRRAYGIRPDVMLPSGQIVAPDAGGEVRSLPLLRAARAHALQESVRWGEPYIFFLAPGIISWIVPMVDGDEVRGGLVGGEVLPDRESRTVEEAAAHLISAGCSRGAALEYLDALPVWPQARTKEAADFLWKTFYAMSGWRPTLLLERRERAQQQREIAEAIHERKTAGRQDAPSLDEKRLLSLIRAGDHRGARAVLNRMLGAMFRSQPNLAVMRASAIELMGYLVRAAVEDSPYLEALIERNHQWMAKIVEAADFETLAVVLREALDDFMKSIYLQGYNPSNPSVRKALEFAAGHFTEPLSVARVAAAAGLSPSRLSHLVKEMTGRTILQHILGLRIREACRQLERSGKSCTDIAYAAGFNDQSYFIKQFRRAMGITPRQYRRLHA